MSRTHKHKPYNAYRKEKKWARRLTNDCVRYTNRDLLKAVMANVQDPDEATFEGAPRTSGWETW